MARRKTGSKKLKPYKIILILLFVWLSCKFGKGFIQQYHLRRELDVLASEIKAFELRNEEIRLEIEKHRSPEYIEQVAREELGLVKPGEIRYIISRPKD